MTSAFALVVAGPVGALADRRRWFWIDAGVTGVNALGHLAAAGVLDGLLGATADTHRLIGGALLLFTVMVAAAASDLDRRRRLGWGVVAANAAWVVASLIVAGDGAVDLTGLGRGWVVAQAVVVGALAGLQARALRTA
jgi:hypothetical protein